MKNFRCKTILLWMLGMLFFARCIAQQDLSQFLKQAQKAANDAKKNNPDKGQNKDAGLPPNYDNSWRMEVSITTTLSSKEDLKSKDPSSHETKTGSATLQFQAHFSSEKNIAWSNGDDIQIGSYARWDDKFKKFGKAPQGSYMVNWQMNEATTSTNGSTKSTFSGNGKANAALADVSFGYNKKTNLGSLDIRNENFDLNGSGSITDCSKGNGCHTIDGTQLSIASADLYTLVFRGCQLYNSFDIMGKNAGRDMLEKSVNDPASVLGVNMGIASISTDAKYDMYTITFSNSKEKNDVPEGWSGTNTLTANTSISVSFFQGNPPQYDAILEVVNLSNGKSDSYDDWIPEGPPVKNQAANQSPQPGNDKGNSIAFRVHLEDKKKPGVELTGVEYDVEWVLSDVSKQPGYCNNYPLKNADDKPDMIFDSILQNSSKFTGYLPDKMKTKDYNGDVPVIITSYDYGGYANLKATATLKYGTPIEAHFKNDKKTVISIPKDDNNNHIADKWELTFNVNNYGADWDEENQDGNSNNGDGLTLYEEYRGIIAKGKHKRLDPYHKDIIIANTSKKDLQEALSFFAKACSMDIVPTEVKAGDELDIDDPVVNKNSLSSHKQYGIVVKIQSMPSDDGDTTEQVLGQAFVKNDISNDVNNGGGMQSHRPHEPVATSPKDVNYLGISSSITDNSLFDYTFAHELAHCLGVQHHGNSKPYFFNSFDRYIIQDTALKYISEAGVPQDKNALLNNLKNNVPMMAALPGSQASGDANCIMCYNQDFEFSFPKGTGGKILYVCDIKHPNGVEFCNTKNGTDRNDKDKKPVSVFGDAITNGNCISQFKIKD